MDNFSHLQNFYMDEKNLEIDSGDVMVVQHDIYLMTIVHLK